MPATQVRVRPKKLAPERRRARPRYRSERNLVRRWALRLREDANVLRWLAQLGFVALCVCIGLEFHGFVQWGLSGGQLPYVTRPPGAEGFLPIAALIGLRHWIATGVVNTIHPAAVFILLAVLLVSVAVKKAFCSWLCPVGTLSEWLWRLGRWVFGRSLTPPRWLDYPLRSLKYLLLLFFLWAVASMDGASLSAFVGSPYNKVADIKMYFFFAHISRVALEVLIVIAALSLLVKNAWCRYLCPYGALLGLVGWISPLKITRNADTCIDCRLCTRACPANIRVHSAGRVASDECTSCLACVAACPARDTLEVRPLVRGRALSAVAVALLVLGLFAGVTGGAMLTGHWQNALSQAEYLRRFPLLDSPLHQHARGHVPTYGPND